MRKFLGLLVVVLLIAGASLGTVSAADQVTVYVVHGIPGLVVDIYVDGNLFVEDFQPGTIAGPLVGPANVSADVAIVPAGGDPASPALAANVSFSPGQNVSVIAHLDANAAPTLSIFENNVAPTSQARVIVRHLAAAPAADEVFFPGTADQFSVGPLANGQEYSTELAPGSYTVGLAPAGTDSIVYGPADGQAQSGKTYIAYAIGSLSDGTFELLIQTIDS